MGEAALDQTEAQLLEDEAKGLNANVAESTAAGAGELSPVFGEGFFVIPYLGEPTYMVL